MLSCRPLFTSLHFNSILALKHKQGEVKKIAGSNSEKSQALANSFFLAKPLNVGVPTDYNYPAPCCGADWLTKDQITHQLCKLKPYKAPGLDSIPNVVLSKCTNILVDRLYYIYKVMLEQNLHYELWKTFVTVVLCKPGKPRYDILKAYQPIALLNTMWKALTAIIADQLTFYSKKYHLLPANHFRGRLGHTTTNVIHLLTHKIKNAWRKGKVTSVLFLDVECHERHHDTTWPKEVTHPLFFMTWYDLMWLTLTTIYMTHLYDSWTLDSLWLATPVYNWLCSSKTALSSSSCWIQVVLEAPDPDKAVCN